MSPETTEYTQINLPDVLAGPIVRQVHNQTLCFWLITSKPAAIHLALHCDDSAIFDEDLSPAQLSQVQVGSHAYVNLIQIKPKSTIRDGARVHYNLSLVQPDGQRNSIHELCADLLYPKQSHPSFIVSKHIQNVLHGSCRKPHHDSQDGLVCVDSEINAAIVNQGKQPDLLIMSGDQVYVDDVAGPMLNAIEQTISLLGLFNEALQGAAVSQSHDLYQHSNGYYERPDLLPDTSANEHIAKTFFAKKKKPIFTSVNANNHLISFAEVIAMYILVWSPEVWPLIKINSQSIKPQHLEQFNQEQKVIEAFCQTLPKVRRALAHIPVYMIFDDHDVTDDWNLTRGWEQAVYQDAFAKRIVGNALIGYWLCQGWGNKPEATEPLYSSCAPHFTANGIAEHDQLIDKLLKWETWHYCIDTMPKIVVLDTRTQRWRSESSLTKPSGLMDWEALSELQQELIDEPSVILVSAAPIFGVKFIETIQRVFTFFGHALTVDAENWMAHKGTASVILNIFRNRKTPPNFVILSGDVHYSFVYDVSLRFRQNSPNITQITSSGIKNQFPPTLLNWLDNINRVLYGPYSPLNWFTKRRNMRIRHRRPEGQTVRTLLNAPGIGLVTVDKHCENVAAMQLTADGDKITFTVRDPE